MAKQEVPILGIFTQDSVRQFVTDAKARHRFLSSLSRVGGKFGVYMTESSAAG